ncbi:MAG: hypothetical protein AAGH15_19870 [Myxococcota bacterium]
MTTLRFALPILFALAACGGPPEAAIPIGTMPEGGSFNGVWQSPQYGEMHLCETGAQVVGRYAKDERSGTVQGTVQGDVLRFTWEEQRELVGGRPRTSTGRGYFKLVAGADGSYAVQGEWGYDTNVTGGGVWEARKLRRREPENCPGTDAGGEAGGEG